MGRAASLGNSKRGSQAPFGRLNEGGSREGEKSKSSPPWCRFLWYLSFGQAKERYAPVPGRDPSLRDAVTRTKKRIATPVCAPVRNDRGTGTSSAPVCALGHLPPEGGRLGRAHRDAPLRQRRETDSLRHGEPLPSAPLTAPPEGEPRGAGTSSGASRHLPRARGRLEGGQAHGRPSGGMAFAALRAGAFSRRGCPAVQSRCRGRGRSRRRPRYRACPGRYPRGCRKRDRGPGRRRGPGWR